MFDYNQLSRSTITCDSAAALGKLLNADNSIYEHLQARNIETFYIHRIHNDDGDFDETINGYKKFFDKYPASYYMYDYEFMHALYYELFYCRTDYYSIIRYATEKFNNKNITALFKNPVWLGYIKAAINGTKDRAYRQTFLTYPVPRWN